MRCGLGGRIYSGLHYSIALCSRAATAWLGMPLAGGPPGGRAVVGALSPPAGHQAVRRRRQAPQTFVVAGIGDAQARHTPLRLYIETPAQREGQQC